MGIFQRVALAVGIVLIDSVVFFIPLTAFFLGYIVVFNPPWFRDFLDNLDVPGRE
jgi:uncharacterized membrane protein